MVRLIELSPNLSSMDVAFSPEEGAIYVRGVPLNSGTGLDDNITLQVPSVYSTLQAAWESLKYTTIQPGVTVTINLQAGTYTHTRALKPHPQGNQIVIQGPTVVFPVESDYVITSDVAVGTPAKTTARAADNANHLIMLKSKFGAEIICDGCTFYDGRNGAVHPYIKNLLVYKAPTQTDYQQDAGIYLYGGLMYMTNMAFHGFNTGAVGTNGGQLRGNVPFSSSADGYLSITASGGYGFQFSDEASIKYTRGVIVCSNTSTGGFWKRAGSGECYGIVSKGNGGHGLSFENGGGMAECADAVVKGNDASGVKTALGGEISIAGGDSIVSGNGQFGLFADAGRILANATEVTNNASGGITASAGGYVDCTNAEIHDNAVFGIKIQGTGVCDAGATNVHDNASVGIWAEYGGTIYAVGATSEDNGSYGIYADSFAKIVATSAISVDNTNAGVAATDGGVIYFTSGVSGQNGKPNAHGILVQTGGQVYAGSANIQYNSGRGLYCIDNGYIDAPSATVANNVVTQAQATGTNARINVLGVTLSGYTGYKDVANSVIYGINNSLYKNTVGADVTATIASGVITATTAYHIVDTEGAAASDDLDTINGGVEGDLLILHTANNARDVTVKNGTGNIVCGSDRVLSNVGDLIVLLNTNGSSWSMIAFADNAA